MGHRGSLCETGQPKLLFLLTAFLYVVTSVHSQFVPPKCSKLCGINPKQVKFQLRKDSHLSSSAPRALVRTGGKCARNAGIANWKVSSRRFLSSVGMNDTMFGCPKLNNIQRRPNNTEIPTFWRSRLYDPFYNWPNAEYPTQHVLRPTLNYIYGIALDSVPATCNIRVDRGVLRQTPNGQFLPSWIIAYTYPRLSGWVFGLVDEATLRFRSIRAPRNKDDKCQGNSCKRYNALWFVSNTTIRYTKEKARVKPENIFSMFADWEYMQVPGMTLMVEELKQAVSKLQEIDNDLSASNLAILCLPIVMSVPPISLLTEVSDTATVWYVFATDIFAILPLLIKGIELIKAYSDARVRIYSTLSMTGKQYGLFERWYIGCAPKKFKTDAIGKLIVLVSVWFMVASVYSEFIFWQRAKHMRKREEKKNVMSDLTDGEILELNHYLGFDQPVKVEETDPNQKRRRNSAIRYAISFLSSVAIVIAVPFTIHIAVLCVSVLLLIFLRAFATGQLRRFLQWQYVAGFAFGFVTGALCLILHSFKSVRKSKGWEDGSDGACAGFASSVAGLYLWFVFSPMYGGPMAPILLFVWVFGASLVLVHVLRNLDEDKALWRCFGHGVAAGFLFGPLGVLFKRWICEIDRNEQTETYFFLGFGFGLNLLASVSLYPLHFFSFPVM